MGKNKEAGRSKTRPSSSSLAASLLPTGVSSVGFGGYLGSSRLQGTTSAEEAQPAPAIDGEVALHLKRLGRKDPTTKLKALTALCTIFKQKSEEDIVQIIPQWAFEYKKLLNDYNREVRRATHETMANLVISVRRGLAPHLKSLMGPWWFSQFDDIPEVSLAARRSLEMAFPAQEKRLDALVLYSNEIFLYLDENLKLTPQAMSDKATPADELEDMHQRVLSSSLLAIATLIDILLGLRSHGCNSEDMVTETRGASKAMAAAIASVENMFSVHKYFLEFLKSKNPRVRSATYKVLGSFIKHISEAFNEENMKMISVVILGSLHEKDASCHSAMWDMILLFSRTFPDSWSHANLQKIVLNRFWQFLRNGCYGSHIISYRTLIVFLGSLPTKIVTEEHFIVNFFGNLWSGRNLIYSQLEDRQAFFKAFKECFLWELFTASRYSAKDDMHLFQNSLIETILIELLWHDYISLVNAKEQIGYPSKVIDSNENGVDCASRRPLETYPSTYMHDLGECIIEILSVIFSKDSTLLITFSTAFQKDCLEIFPKEGSSQRFSECIERIVNFFLLLGQHITEKNQLWPLEYLAGPLVASTFPLIKSLDSPDAVRMLSVVIDIFGPRPIVLNIFPLDKEQDAKKSNEKCKSESNAVHFLRVFRDNFIPWCLTGQSRSISSRLDLLLALLDDELFYEQWQLILLYATKLEQHSPTENWVFDSECACILAMFVEKVRNKIQNKATIPSSKQNWFQPEHWGHELLDTAAIAVACHSSSTGIAHAPFLRAVIGYSSENDQICFVSKEALAIIFESTLKNFLSVLATSSYNWVRVACSSLMSIGLQDLTQKNELSLIENDEVARFSLEVLDGSFFCLSNLDQNCKLVPCILAAIFIFEWEISMATQGLSDGSSWDQDDVRFSLGKGARALRCKISTNFWRNLSPYNLLILRNVLTEAVRSAISETNTPINDKVPTLCCSWVLDVLDIICCNHGEQQTMLDQLFSEDNDWPIWVAPDFTDGKRSAILLSKTTSVDDCRHLQFVAFIEKLISKLGFIRVIAGLDQENYTSYSRSWLAAEILCTWKWNGGNVLESFLPLFSDYAKTVSNFHEENAVSSVVQILVDGAILHGTSSRLRSSNVWTVSEDEVEDIQDPSLRALISSLLTLVVKNKIWRKDEALLLFEYVIDKLAIGTSINRSCLRILPYILNVISHELLKRNSEKGISFDSSSEDSVHGTIVSWLQTSLSLPPLDFEKSVDKDLEEWIEIIISCYPLSAEGGPFNVEDIGDISHKEKTLILNLFRKQRLGAIATVSSATDGIASTVSVSVQMILANLAAISVGYCWQEFDDDDWDFVLSHLHGWIASSVPMIEEIVEKVDDAVSSKVTVEAGKKKLELAVQDVDPSLITISRTALISFSLISQLSNAKQAELAQFSTSEKWNHHKDRILEDVIRLFFAAGAAEAIASSLSEDASSIIASSLFACSGYWELVASCVISSPVHVREKAIQAMELWGLSAGVVSALFGLLFSCKPISSLQFAAYNFLSAEPLCYVSLFKEGIRTMNAYGDQNPSIPSDVESSLDEPIRLRDDISLVIENPCSQLLEMDLVSRHRVNFLLGWALLLSHLQSLPSSSLARERLIQHLQDSANSIILDCIFQHIPLRPGLMQNLKKKDLELPLEVSKAANAAKHAITTCSVSFAVESLWPIGTEQMASFSGSIYGLMIHLLPAYVRNWFTSLRDRSLSSAIESFTKGWCSPPLIADEFSQVKEVLVADDNFSVTVNKSALEIVATYKKEETGMDLVIRLPSCYPLRPVDVDCTRSLGISEVKQRKWLLSLTAFVRNQNGAIAEAIQTWKRNFDKEFQGIEECPICYSIIHTSNHSLPRLACKTCKHKFHSACLFKWFSTSHKSLCPLCQMPFQYNS